jgi:hypothetical protein
MSWTPIRLVVKYLPPDLTQQELLEKLKPYDSYLHAMDYYPAKIEYSQKLPKPNPKPKDLYLLPSFPVLPAARRRC